MKIIRTDLELETPHNDATLRAAGHDLTLLPDGIAEDALIEAVRDADLLLMCYTPITARVIAAANRLKGIVKYGVGIDAIDIPAARARGIAVVNIPECVSIALTVDSPISNPRMAANRNALSMRNGSEEKTSGFVILMILRSRSPAPSAGSMISPGTPSFPIRMAIALMVKSLHERSARTEPPRIGEISKKSSGFSRFTTLKQGSSGFLRNGTKAA